MADLNFPNSPVDGQEHEGYIFDAINGVWLYIAASVIANNETIRLTAAFNQANAAFLAANNAGGADSFARDTANAAFDRANSANLLAFNSAAGANGWTNTVFGLANTKFLANTTGTFAGSLTITEDLITRGNVTLGDASTDTITLNGSTISLGNNQSIDSGTLFIDAVNNRVGIGTTAPSYRLEVAGSFAAQTKSFVIDHHTKPYNKLVHGSLEGPENGVYYRGKSKKKTIELPDYWSWLVDEETITVTLTPIGKKQDLFVKEIKDNKVIIGGARTVEYYYTVYAERKDVPKLIVEC